MGVIQYPNRLGEQVLPANGSAFTANELETLVGGKIGLTYTPEGVAVASNADHVTYNATVTDFVNQPSVVIYGPAVFLTVREAEAVASTGHS